MQMEEPSCEIKLDYKKKKKPTHNLTFSTKTPFNRKKNVLDYLAAKLLNVLLTDLSAKWTGLENDSHLFRRLLTPRSCDDGWNMPPPPPDPPDLWVEF